jgi:hypothetical protein
VQEDLDSVFGPPLEMVRREILRHEGHIGFSLKHTARNSFFGWAERQDGQFWGESNFCRSTFLSES